MKAFNSSIIDKLVLVLFIAPLQFNAQNLIPSNSFEETSSLLCSFWGSGDLNARLSDWKSPNEQTPDIYSTNVSNSCKMSATGNGSYSGFQVPYDGENMLGLVGTVDDWDGGGTEYAQCMLIEPLVIGKHYTFEMDVSLGNNCQYACSKIGAYFTTSAYEDQGSFGYKDVTPQFLESAIIKDTVNWVHLEYNFVADDAYSHITIGVFGKISDADMEYIEFNSSGSAEKKSFYYYDNISLIESNPVSITDESNLSPLAVSYSPHNQSISIENLSNYNSLSISIYDIQGQLISSENLYKETLINTKFWNPGMYFYNISKSNKPIQSGKLIINQ